MLIGGAATFQLNLMLLFMGELMPAIFVLASSTCSVLSKHRRAEGLHAHFPHVLRQAGNLRATGSRTFCAR
jgi:hypothetical protein